MSGLVSSLDAMKLARESYDQGVKAGVLASAEALMGLADSGDMSHEDAVTTRALAGILAGLNLDLIVRPT